MSTSSSYGGSIKFYDRISSLQSELKNYESESFALEQEFDRIRKQSPSVDGHLKSYVNDDNEARRRNRNETILEKLQQFESNASIFAARSERLRLMRAEYETLVQKYANKRKRWPSSSSHAVPNGNNTSVLLVTTGVNTDITGPIQPLKSNVAYLEQESSDDLLLADENRFSNGHENHHPHSRSYLDLSTSESELTTFHRTKTNERRILSYLDDTSDTSMSNAILPKSKELAAQMLDLSFSESSSSINGVMNKPIIKTTPSNQQKTDKVHHDPTTIREASHSHFTTEKVKSGTALQAKFLPSLDISSSPDSSIDDSSVIMDSTQNTTPDSLPSRNDDSELMMNITDKRNEQLINEDDKNENDELDSQEAQDDLSFTKLSMVAEDEEEIPIQSVIHTSTPKRNIHVATTVQSSNKSQLHYSTTSTDKPSLQTDHANTKNEIKLVSTTNSQQVVSKQDFFNDRRDIERQVDRENKMTTETIAAFEKKKELSDTIIGFNTIANSQEMSSKSVKDEGPTNRSGSISTLGRPRIKLDYADYTDSDSELSEKEPIAIKANAYVTGGNSININSKPTEQQPVNKKIDDDFDDFFDI